MPSEQPSDETVRLTDHTIGERGDSYKIECADCGNHWIISYGNEPPHSCPDCGWPGE